MTRLVVGGGGAEVRGTQVLVFGKGMGRRFGQTPVTTTTWWTRDAHVRVYYGRVRIFRYRETAGTLDKEHRCGEIMF